jgi:hypothetical protein
MTYKIVNLQKWARQYVLDPNSQNRGNNSRAPSTGGHINPYDEVFPGIYLGDRYLLIRPINQEKLIWNDLQEKIYALELAMNSFLQTLATQETFPCLINKYLSPRYIVYISAVSVVFNAVIFFFDRLMYLNDI